LVQGPMVWLQNPFSCWWNLHMFGWLVCWSNLGKNIV
jgi:hypothetical protein